VLEHIDIAVQWQKDSRTVTVRFDVQPVVAEGIRYVPQKLPLDPKDLISKESLLKFLADATRAEPGGTTVEATCLDDDVPDLLRVLDISYPIPDPITVRLPSRG